MNDHIPLNPYDEELLKKVLEQSANGQVVYRGSFAQHAQSPLVPGKDSFDHAISVIRIESMVEVLESVASEPELMHGSTAYVSTDRLLERAKQLRKMIFNGKR